MEGGVIAINQILEWHTLTKSQGSFSFRPGPHMQDLLIHQETHVNISSACTQAHQSRQLKLPLSLHSPNSICHTLFKKPRATDLPRCPSVRVHLLPYIQLRKTIRSCIMVSQVHLFLPVQTINKNRLQKETSWKN